MKHQSKRPFARQKKKELSWSRVMMGVSVLGVLGLMTVHLRGEVIETQYRTQQVEAATQEARRDIRALRMQISQLSNPERLENWAMAKGGMVRPTKKVFAYKSGPLKEAVVLKEQ